MKSALTHLEAEFESLLDSYCTALEQGDVIEAEVAAFQAEDYLEAIDVLKFSRDMSGVEMGT